MHRPQCILGVFVAVAASAAVLSCVSAPDFNGGNTTGSEDDTSTESRDTPPPSAASVFVAADTTRPASDTLPVSTSSPSEMTAAASTLLDRSAYWQTLTGLEGPADIQVWDERVAMACNSSMWEPGSAEKIAAAFVRDDAGDASDPDLVESASWALWILTSHDTGCSDRFPRAATHPITWLHMTGLFGPLDMATWRERLEPFCGVPSRSAMATDYRELAERIASEYITEDGGDPHKSPGLLNQAADLLWIMSRTPGTCAEDSESLAGLVSDR